MEKEWKIGEIRQINGEWYQCVIGRRCKDCVFNKERKCYTFTNNNDPIGDCSAERRTDKYSVIFKKLQKVGEPFEFDGYIFQAYCTFAVPIFTENYATVRELGNNSKISIEIKQIKQIKQNKEDMEIDKVVMNIDDRDYLLDRLEAILHDTHCQQYIDEICGALSKYIVTETAYGLKPFDLNAAKAGKPVCTRDGRKARIICFDRKDNTPIVALIERVDGIEILQCFYNDGKCFHDSTSDNDLMMLPEKRSGWIIVSKNATIYDSLEEAKESFDSDKELCVCKAEWEE